MNENIDKIARQVQRLFEEAQDGHIDPFRWPTFPEVVRFTLEAIREPSGEMKRAGGKADGPSGHVPLPLDCEECVESVWRAMIDELLREAGHEKSRGDGSRRPESPANSALD